MGASLSIPGFGWTTNPPNSVILCPGGQLVPLPEEGEEFPSSFAHSFLTSSLKDDGINLVSAEELSKMITYNMKERLPATELDEFLLTRLSNGTRMKWDIMRIRKNVAFRLHIHSTIECIYVVKGSISEHRKIGVPIAITEFEKINEASAADTSTFTRKVPVTTDMFCTRTVKQGEFIVNEIGSMHLSYTEEEDAILLVLWCGKHLNIPSSMMPVTLPLVPNSVQPYT